MTSPKPSHAQAKAFGVVVTVKHPMLGEVWHVASPLRIDEAPAPPGAPFRGERTYDVLRGVGPCSDAEIDAHQLAGGFDRPAATSA